MVKIIYLGLLIIGLTPKAKAQKFMYDNEGAYKTAIGLRGGGERGLSVKHFLTNSIAVEGLLTTASSYGGTRLTALLQRQTPINLMNNFSWYYGAGVHIGFYYDKVYAYNQPITLTKNKYSTVALNGIFGLEYKVGTLPFTISLDIKPYANMVGEKGLLIDKGATVRYIFRY